MAWLSCWAVGKFEGFLSCYRLVVSRSVSQILPNPALAGVAAGAVYSHVVLERELEVVSPHACARPPVNADLLVVLRTRQVKPRVMSAARGGEGIGTHVYHKHYSVDRVEESTRQWRRVTRQVLQGMLFMSKVHT